MAANCTRCGRCCISVGKTFWRVGVYNGGFDKYPELKRRAENTEGIDNGLPCEMLLVEDGVATCKIERDYGIEAKPLICRTYPGEGEPCQRLEALLGLTTVDINFAERMFLDGARTQPNNETEISV